MNKEFAVLLALALAVNALHLQQSHQDYTPDLPGGTVALQADSGQFLSVCHLCGTGADADSASFQTDLQSWTLQVIGTQVAFRGINGKYLARCRDCWDSKYKDSAFVHVPDTTSSFALWTPILTSNGKYAFKSDNGKYLARCNSCAANGQRSDFAFIHYDDPTGAALFNVIYINLPKLGVRTFQADNGQYLKYCPDCGRDYAVGISSDIDDNSRWTISRVGTKVAIQGANGNFLSRCEGCWTEETYPNSALVHLDNPSKAYSKWTPSKQPNGKWVFLADNGKYLARCNNCTTASTNPNLAFVYVTDPSDVKAQWSLGTPQYTQN